MLYFHYCTLSKPSLSQCNRSRLLFSCRVHFKCQEISRSLYGIVPGMLALGRHPYQFARCVSYGYVFHSLLARAYTSSAYMQRFSESSAARNLFDCHLSVIEVCAQGLWRVLPVSSTGKICEISLQNSTCIAYCSHQDI